MIVLHQKHFRVSRAMMPQINHFTHFENSP